MQIKDEFKINNRDPFINLSLWQKGIKTLNDMDNDIIKAFKENKIPKEAMHKMGFSLQLCMIFLEQNCEQTTIQNVYTVKEQDKTYSGYIQFGSFESEMEANLFLANFLNNNVEKIIKINETTTIQ